ncbi:MAG: hotdog domain-containing protein [Nocardioides sp.]
MRTIFDITTADCRPQGDHVDPTAPGYGSHLPFHAILQRCGIAWSSYLLNEHDIDTSVIVPNINANFLAEVHPGQLDVDVVVTRVGGSSFTVQCRVVQDAQPVATVDVVLVAFDYDQRASRPIAPRHRESLEAALTTV